MRQNLNCNIECFIYPADLICSLSCDIIIILLSWKLINLDYFTNYMSLYKIAIMLLFNFKDRHKVQSDRCAEYF